MGKKIPDSQTATASDAEKELTTEELFEQLDCLLEKMESETSLEKMFAMYRQGLELTQLCDEKLGGMEREIRILRDGDDEDE